MRSQPATVSGAGRLDGEYCGGRCLARAAAGLSADDNEALAQLQKRLDRATADVDALREERDEVDAQLTTAEQLYVQLVQVAPAIKDGRVPGVAGGQVRQLVGQLRDALRPKVRRR